MKNFLITDAGKHLHKLKKQNDLKTESNVREKKFFFIQINFFSMYICTCVYIYRHTCCTIYLNDFIMF